MAKRFMANGGSGATSSNKPKVCLVIGHNITANVFFDRLAELTAKAFKVVHPQTFSWPDGIRFYQAVWRKVDDQEN